jgi:hypothetical protein
MTAAEAREHLQGRQTEEQLHKACVRWADVQAAARPALKTLFHVPNGGKMPKGTAGKLKGQGLKKGVPDLVLPVVRTVFRPDDKQASAGGLWIELKSQSGRLRDSQAWWRDALRNYGQAWTLCRSLGGFQETVTNYLDGAFELD